MAAKKPEPAPLQVGKLLRLLTSFIVVSAVAGVFAAGLSLPIVGAVGVTVNAGASTFDYLPEEFTIPAPSQQSAMYASDGSTLTTFYAENRIVVPLRKISPYLQKATVAIEDHRFFEHRGVDFESMVRAAISNFAGKARQGASTLTQQYVKNVLIEKGRIANDKAMIQDAQAPTITRKVREAKYAVAVEKKLSKLQILEGYLNIAQFGPSVYGVEAAARHYFSKPAKDLNLAESALLAGMPQSPNGHDPEQHPENAEKRRNTVLWAMQREGYITEEQRQEAANIPLQEMLHISNTHQGCGLAGNAAYFCSYAVNEILRSPEFGDSFAARQQLLLRGGLQIHTTLDPEKQQAAYDSLVEQVPVNDASNLKMALASIEPGTGKIKALAQNTEFGNKPGENYITENSYNVDGPHGGGAGFPTGSTFKAFTLAQWYLTGHGGYDIVGGRYFFPASAFKAPCNPGVLAPYNVTEVGGQHAASSVVHAIQISNNSPFIDMASRMDLCDISDLVAKLGITYPNGKHYDPRPSFILGTESATPLAMANAFATFAARGTYCSPIALTAVRDSNGKNYPVPSAHCVQVLPPKVADKVTATLAMGVTGGIAFKAALPDRPSAGKTGTVNDYAHTWYVGYIPQLSTAVWMGHSEGFIPVTNVTINGRFWPIVYGMDIPAPTWGAYMKRITGDMPVEKFTPTNLNRSYTPDWGRNWAPLPKQTAKPSTTPTPTESSPEAPPPPAEGGGSAEPTEVPAQPTSPGTTVPPPPPAENPGGNGGNGGGSGTGGQ